MKRFVGRLTWESDTRLHRLPYPELHDGIVVLWRGTIANREELIRHAAVREEKLESPSDGEILVDAYRWWGDELQIRVRGEYAVALYEHRTRTLLLTHDALGVMPLFYSAKTDGLSFSSHLEDLVEMTEAGAPDLRRITEYLTSGSAPGDLTAYPECRRLDLGESLLWRNGRLAKRRAGAALSPDSSRRRR